MLPHVERDYDTLQLTVLRSSHLGRLGRKINIINRPMARALPRPTLPAPRLAAEIGVCHRVIERIHDQPQLCRI
jgi:hypothetical protein